MSTQELKAKRITLILQAENSSLLEEVSRLLKLEGEEAEVAELTPIQKKAFLKRAGELREGRFLTNKEADKEIEAWLNG